MYVDTVGAFGNHTSNVPNIHFLLIAMAQGP